MTADQTEYHITCHISGGASQTQRSACTASHGGQFHWLVGVSRSQKLQLKRGWITILGPMETQTSTDIMVYLHHAVHGSISSTLLALLGSERVRESDRCMLQNKAPR